MLEWLWALILRYHQPYAYFTTFLTYSLNFLLLYLIKYKSRGDFGPYRNLLKYLAIFNVIYSTAHSLILPKVYGGQYYFFVVPTGALSDFLDQQGQTLLGAIISSLFGVNNTVLAIHFVFRYIQICHSHRDRLLRGKNQLLWFAIVLICFGIWMVTCVNLVSPAPEKDVYLIDFETFSNHSLRNRGYVGPAYWITSNSEVVFNYRDMFGMLSLSCAACVPLNVMCFCGYKTYQGMKRTVGSPKTKKLQRQLFISLVVLTTIPLMVIYGPMTLLFICPAFGINTGRLGLLYHCFLVVPPFFDPIILISFITDYRRQVQRFIRDYTCLKSLGGTHLDRITSYSASKH
ncbi:unnamed protein product, partial [Mesorhabditis spiculigera]